MLAACGRVRFDPASDHEGAVEEEEEEEEEQVGRWGSEAGREGLWLANTLRLAPLRFARFARVVLFACSPRGWGPRHRNLGNRMWHNQM